MSYDDPTAKVDHAAVAREQIAPYPHNLDPFASALVHATLALVEQQRIANLLALAAHRYEDGEGGFVMTTREGAVEMRRTASVLLGVNEDGSLS